MILSISVVVAVVVAALLAAILDNPAAVGLIVGLPATVMGVYAIVRTRRVDKEAASSAAVSAGASAARDVVKGLNTLIDNLQEDNKMLRKEQARLQEKIIKVETDCAGIRTEMERLTRVSSDRRTADDLADEQKGVADQLLTEQQDEAKRVVKENNRET